MPVTVSGGTDFDSADYVEPQPLPEAKEIANAKAAELGYTVEEFDPFEDDFDIDDID